jgi:hypothetical protein
MATKRSLAGDGVVMAILYVLLGLSVAIGYAGVVAAFYSARWALRYTADAWYSARWGYPGNDLNHSRRAPMTDDEVREWIVIQKARIDAAQAEMDKAKKENTSNDERPHA